jgi:hypothetical protein
MELERFLASIYIYPPKSSQTYSLFTKIFLKLFSLKN